MFRCRWQCDLRRYGRQPSACAISDLAIASNAGRRAPSAAVTLPITPPPSCRVKKLLPIGGGKLPGGRIPATARRAVDLESEVGLAGHAVVEPLCRRPR